jgi:hypothetical protein
MAPKKKQAGARGSRKRRGQGEEFTEEKENEVEVRAPVLQGDLILPASDVYAMHRKKIKASLDAKESANGKYRKDLEQAQLAGIDTDMMLEAFKIVRANSPQELMNRLNQLSFCLEQEGYPIRILLKDTLIGDEMALVYRRVFQDTREGKSFDNPYPVGSDMHLQAQRAFRHATALNAGTSIEDIDNALDADTAAQEAKLPPPPKLSPEGQPLH